MKRVIGWWRLRYGFCPLCNSSPPRRDCPVCEGDPHYWREADAAKRAMWRERYRAHIGCRSYDCVVARCPKVYRESEEPRSLVEVQGDLARLRSVKESFVDLPAGDFATEVSLLSVEARESELLAEESSALLREQGGDLELVLDGDAVMSGAVDAQFLATILGSGDGFGCADVFADCFGRRTEGETPRAPTCIFCAPTAASPCFELDDVRFELAAEKARVERLTVLLTEVASYLPSHMRATVDEYLARRTEGEK